MAMRTQYFNSHAMAQFEQESGPVDEPQHRSSLSDAKTGGAWCLDSQTTVRDSSLGQLEGLSRRGIMPQKGASSAAPPRTSPGAL